MNPFEMVVAIIIVITIGKVLQARFKARHDAGATRPDSAETVRAREEIRALKERISVLERVITDSHSSVELDREIERLRDSNKV
jgi:hypothetical protein